jgi:hypothetical protein
MVGDANRKGLSLEIDGAPIDLLLLEPQGI